MIPQLKVYVNGSASVFRKAERGVLHIRVWHTSKSQSDASSAVATKSDTLTTLFRQHALKTDDHRPHPDAAITTFTLSAPSTSSQLPISQDTGRAILDAARLYTAQTTAEVVFRDVDLLAKLAVELSAMEDVAIEQTEWRLTDPTRDEITREARISAVKNAVQKANDYAGVVGREVVAHRIDDGNVSSSSTRTRQTARQAPMFHPDLMVSSSMPMAQQIQMPQQMPTAQGQAAGMLAVGPALEPATITVSATVSVQFISKDGKDMPGGDD